MKKELTWEEIIAEKVGTILYDKFDEGLRFIIMRGPSSLCAYVGLPIGHPLSGKNYDDLPVSAHYGLTYSNKGDGHYPKNFWWYGWDYSHAGDYSFYYDDVTGKGLEDLGDKKWLVKDVIEDSWDTIYDFKKLMKLAETISKSS